MARLNPRGLSRNGEVRFLVGGFHLAYRDEAARAARMWLDASRVPSERTVLASVVAALALT